MVSGKPSNQSARQMDKPSTTRLIWFFSRTDLWEYVLHGRQEYGFCSRATDVCPAHIGCAYGPASRLWWPVPQPGMKGKRLLRNDHWMFQACVLGLPCKVKFDLDRPPLTRIETAYPFCHIE
jgi:hypothetical protein